MFFQNTIKNATKNVIVKIIINAARKIISATFSKFSPCLSFFERIDKNERILAIINNKEAIPVNSSISVASWNFDIFKEVNTNKQKPRRFEAVERMCGDLLFDIHFYLFSNDKLNIFLPT